MRTGRDWRSRPTSEAMDNIKRLAEDVGLPPEKVQEYEERIKAAKKEHEVRLCKSGCNRTKFQQRVTGVIPKNKYREARAFAIKMAADLLRDERGVPCEIFERCFEQFMDRKVIPQFMCDMGRQGIFEPHPLGGWMAARPRGLKAVGGRVVEALPVPPVSSDVSSVPPPVPPKCVNCGGETEWSEVGKVVDCYHCGTSFGLPNLDKEIENV